MLGALAWGSCVTFTNLHSVSLHFSGGATPRSSCPVSKHLDGDIFTLMLHELMYNVRALIYLKYMMMTAGGSFGIDI